MQQSAYIYNNLASQSHSNSPTKEEYENISLEEQPINMKDYLLWNKIIKNIDQVKRSANFINTILAYIWLIGWRV